MDIISEMVEVHIFRKCGGGNIEFLVMKRGEKEIYPGLWQMVTGKIKKGEKAYETALREIKEETGLTPERIWVVPNVNSFYSHEKDCISLLPVFAAEASEGCSVQISKEHCDYKWMTADKAAELFAWEGQRRSVNIILNYFVKEKSTLDLLEIRLK